MSKKYNILILGASYGSLLGSKMLLAGHNVTLVCLPAEVEIINDDGPLPFPLEHQRLLPLLRRIAGDMGTTRIPEPHRYDDAEWVGFRITEILPVQNLAKQKLLELEDPISRLEILEKFLDQRKLLG